MFRKKDKNVQMGPDRRQMRIINSPNFPRKHDISRNVWIYVPIHSTCSPPQSEQGKDWRTPSQRPKGLQRLNLFQYQDWHPHRQLNPAVQMVSLIGTC